MILGMHDEEHLLPCVNGIQSPHLQFFLSIYSLYQRTMENHVEESQ